MVAEGEAMHFNTANRDALEYAASPSFTLRTSVLCSPVTTVNCFTALAQGTEHYTDGRRYVASRLGSHVDYGPPGWADFVGVAARRGACPPPKNTFKAPGDCLIGDRSAIIAESPRGSKI